MSDEAARRISEARKDVEDKQGINITLGDKELTIVKQLNTLS